MNVNIENNGKKRNKINGLEAKGHCTCDAVVNLTGCLYTKASWNGLWSAGTASGRLAFGVLCAGRRP